MLYNPKQWYYIMNYKTRINEAEKTIQQIKEDKKIQVKNTLAEMKQLHAEIWDISNELYKNNINYNIDEDQLCELNPQDLILIIKKQRKIRLMNELRTKVIKILKGHDVYVAALNIYGNGIDYSLVK